jgi:hypothetical protein
VSLLELFVVLLKCCNLESNFFYENWGCIECRPFNKKKGNVVTQSSQMPLKNITKTCETPLNEKSD